MASIVYKGRLALNTTILNITDLELINLYSRLIAYWPFDETSGERKGVNNLDNLTVTGTVDRVAGPSTRYEYGIDCLSPDVKLKTSSNAPASVAFASLDKFSIAGWIYPYSSSFSQRTIMQRRTPTNDWWLMLTSSRQITFNKWLSDVIGIATSTTTVPLEQWSFVCVSFDSLTGSGFLSINGAIENFTVTPGISKGASAITIASDNIGSDRYWQGRLAGFSIFGDTITELESEILRS